MTISIPELRAISERLWNYLEAAGYEHIELKRDFYWHIPENSAYDLKNEPTVHDVGQLSDDWSELHKLLETDREPIAYDLVWLSTLLRAIGEQIAA